MNYHSTNDYVIDLENVYKMIGFANKANAKRTLVNNFTENEDYKISVIPKDERVHGAQNEETIMLNIDTFKNLCIMKKTFIELGDLIINMFEFNKLFNFCRI